MSRFFMVYCVRREYVFWLQIFSAATLHCVSKNIPDVFSYNSRKHCRIFIIFGGKVTQKASNQKMLYFSTSPN